MTKALQVIITDPRLNEMQIGPDKREHDSAGLDLRAMFEGDGPLVLPPRTAALIPTGLSIWIQFPDYVGLIFPRSGSGHKRGIVLGNGTGVIDADYQGPLMLSVLNRTDVPVSVELGERIAQLVIVPIVRPEIKIVSQFPDVTTRGAAGFGSTGHK